MEFMKRLARYVQEHHLERDEKSEQVGLVDEYFDTTRESKADRWVQGEALDTMHDGAWLAAALVSAHRAAGVITFRRGEVLKGNERRRTFRHVVSAELLPKEECADLLAWAEAGRLAVCFWSENEHLVCVGNHWYHAAEEGGNEWSANPV